MATGFGLKAVRKLDGGEIRLQPFVIPASDSTVYGVGAPVELAAGVDAATGLPTIVYATAAHSLVGVIQGFEADPTQPYAGDYRPASTRRIALVSVDPDTVYQVQEDAVGGSVSAANAMAGFNADIVVSAATSTTRIDGTMLDSSTAAATSATLKIVGQLRDDVNDAAQSGGAILEVVIFEHALRQVDSIRADGSVTE